MAIDEAGVRGHGKTKIIEEVARFFFAEARPIDGSIQKLKTDSTKLNGPIQARCAPVTSMPLRTVKAWARELAAQAS